MRITKFVHSCLLVEEGDKTVLIDPGDFSVDLLKPHIASLPKLDYLLITHEHFDHMNIPLVKEIDTQFKPTVMSTESVRSMLSQEGIEVQTAGDKYVQIESVPHESMAPLGQAPQNVLFHIGEKLTHPGDSHSFSQTKEVLALPVQAPWGSMINAVNLALNLSSKKIIPIHDWHWNMDARLSQYTRLQEFFLTKRIEFIPAQDGIPFDA
jgi:L-ascorbate metabolism protein UlaG (beta-lactamase superfamily)